MKKKIITMLVALLLAVNLMPTAALATDERSDDIVILYENDVHCAIEGYSKLAALKNELKETHEHVGVVSCGDYIQGSSLGIVSQGEYIVELMNLVGYDAVALGNHEFDYRLERLEELIGKMDTKPVCCNFQKIGEDAPYFEPYSIVSYGNVDVAYIGITTPSTITFSSPMQFKDENGNYIYTFNPSTLYEIVQQNIDAAKAAGADYVIAISHIGYTEGETNGGVEDVETLIKNTDGLDVVLDAHSHSVIEGKAVTDKQGNEVLLSSTGTKFAHIGKLTISGDALETELIKTEEYPSTDPILDACIGRINAEYEVLGERLVATSEVDLVTADADGNRLVRKSETNLGNLCADSFRYIMDADIGYVNGGGIRTDIGKGDVTFNDLLSVFPFNNTVIVAELSGQTIKDMLEMTVMSWPAENGCFPHVSGITFSVNTKIPSPVVVDERGEFVSVSGEYRVYDIEIYNKETEQYEPISLTKTYTLAASNYYLLEYGNGLKMLENAKIIQNEGILDVEVLERYIVEMLGGTIGEEYAVTNATITFTDGKPETAPENGSENNDQENLESNVQESPATTDDPTQENASYTVVWIIAVAAGLSLLLAAVILIKKKR